MASVIYALGLYFLLLYGHPPSGAPLISIAFLLGVPVAAPSLGILIWDPRGERQAHAHTGFAIGVVSAMIVAGFVVLREAGICLVMAAPLFYLGGIGAAIFTGYLLRRRNARLMSFALILLPILAMPVEAHVQYPQQTETITSVVDIDAPVAAVWRNLASVTNIRLSELGWTFTQDVIGVPKPLDARLDGEGVGAVRHARWGRGVHFDEKITRWIAGRDLSWRFVFTPDSIPPAVEGNVRLDRNYLSIDEGGYHLEPLSGGRSRLRLETRYTMRTPLNAYCALWGKLFIGDFHRNILHVVKARSENGALVAHR
jgi:hypothetical protein